MKQKGDVVARTAFVANESEPIGLDRALGDFEVIRHNCKLQLAAGARQRIAEQARPQGEVYPRRFVTP